MDLFGLPLELVQLIFEQIVSSRSFQRVMRIRKVNRQFKSHIDYSIFRMRYLSRLVGPPNYISGLSRPIRPERGFFSYVQSYIMYQVLRETPVRSPLGRIGQAARAICEIDGKTGNEAIAACIRSLIRLPMYVNLNRLLGKHKAEEPEECSDRDLEADIYISAIYFGKQSYVESLINNNNTLLEVLGTDLGFRSTVFGTAFHAATMQGNHSMIQLLLTCIDAYGNADLLPHKQGEILVAASSYHHQAIVKFAFNMRTISLPEQGLQRRTSPDLRVLQTVFRSMPPPQTCEQIAAILGPDDGMSRSFGKRVSNSWLKRSILLGNTELVHYLLDKGANPDYSEGGPLLAAIQTDNEAMVRTLLDAGADPNLSPRRVLPSLVWVDTSMPLPPNVALMHAVWKGNVSILQLLLPRITNVDEGDPPPIVLAVFKERLDIFRLLREHGARIDTPETGGLAMAIAKSHELSSMVDALISEGVDRDVVLHQAANIQQVYWLHFRMWPLQ
ncbi:ankyrin [Xylaria sp. FL0933]|nr:ankyrin [Xylaria sp. FL0933]